MDGAGRKECFERGVSVVCRVWPKKSQTAVRTALQRAALLLAFAALALLVPLCRRRLPLLAGQEQRLDLLPGADDEGLGVVLFLFLLLAVV